MPLPEKRRYEITIRMCGNPVPHIFRRKSSAPSASEYVTSISKQIAESVRIIFEDETGSALSVKSKSIESVFVESLETTSSVEESQP